MCSMDRLQTPLKILKKIGQMFYHFLLTYIKFNFLSSQDFFYSNFVGLVNKAKYIPYGKFNICVLRTLPTAYCLLSTVYCLLPTVFSLFLVFDRLLFHFFTVSPFHYCHCCHLCHFCHFGNFCYFCYFCHFCHFCHF